MPWNGNKYYLKYTFLLFLLHGWEETREIQINMYAEVVGLINELFVKVVFANCTFPPKWTPVKQFLLWERQL